jgi:hypothetical protein
MNKMNRNIKVLSCFMAAAVFFSAAGAFGTEIYIPKAKTKPGKTIEIPIMIDKTDNLAGVKMVLKYDAKVLEYINGEKTKHTSSLMHVVNDKNPGVLVIVMAGAKGIAGKDMALFTLKFKANAGLKAKTSAGLAIKELQLMSDQLKDIECKIKINDLVVSP